MSFNYFGLCIILIGAFSLYSVFMNKNNMPKSIFTSSKDNYEVVNKERFNKIMILQSTSIGFWFIIVGVSAIILQNYITLLLGASTIVVCLAFSSIAKKHVKFIA